MIAMDRENLFAPGWSHVCSTTNDVAELDAFRARVGAPRAALQVRGHRWPHLDLRGPPRELALTLPDVRVFERTADLLRFLRHELAARDGARGQGREGDGRASDSTVRRAP